MITGNGINTVTVNGKVKHITELDYITLCLEWTKLREENNRLYEINNKANRGWRGFILRLIGVNRKRLVRTVLIFTESSDQLSRATDRVPGLPASPGYVQ